MGKVLSVPSVSFRLSDYPVHERMEIWHDFSSSAFGIGVNELPKTEVFADVSTYNLGHSFIGKYQHSRLILRGAEMRATLSRDELLVLGMHYKGGAKGLLNDTKFEMSPDFLTLYDAQKSIHAKTSDVEYFEIMFPYSAVGYDPSMHPAFLHIAVGTPIGKILKNNFEMLLEHVPNIPAHDARVLANGFFGLLRSILARDFREETSRMQFAKAQEAAVHRFIRENLGNPKLNDDLICQTIGLSRPVLYRLFSEDGGVQKAIQKQRLEQALEELSYTEPNRGAIARVSQNWTFSDPAHFSRLFREAFGFRPTDALGSALVSNAPRCQRDPGQERPKRKSKIPRIELHGAINTSRSPHDNLS